MSKIYEKKGYLVVQQIGKNKENLNVGKSCDKGNFLKVQAKRVALIDSMIKLSIDMTPRQREEEARR